MRISLASGVFAGLVLVLASACGGSGATQAPPASGAAPASQAASATCASGPGAGQQVAAVDIQFNPSTATVAAGGTVTWTNGDSVAHTITFDNGPDCGNLAPASSTTVTFPAAGTYAYHCKIHPQMTGTVTVS